MVMEVFTSKSFFTEKNIHKVACRQPKCSRTFLSNVVILAGSSKNQGDIWALQTVQKLILQPRVPGVFLY